MFLRNALLPIFCLVAVGCAQHNAPPAAASAAAPLSAPVAAAPATAATEPAIAWYAGSVESAFEQARKDNKPVFIYWGASWCPPCHELKATVFSRPDFIEKLKLFIPVYLDGDGAGAQKWGERFSVSGYPTVLVLRSDQSELARISGGMDLTQYAKVLDTVLGDVRPVSTILASVKSGGARPLSHDDCHRLAFYSWGLVDDVDKQYATLSHTLSQAAALCPADTTKEKDRLILESAGMAAAAEEKALTVGKAPSEKLVQIIGQVDGLLKNPARANDVVDEAGDLDDGFFRAVAKYSPHDAPGWNQRYAALMDAGSTDPRFSTADHLYFVYYKLVAAKALDPQRKVSPQLATQANQRIDAALAGKIDEHSRTSVVNAAQNILEVLGDDDRAYKITREQMALSKSPYYYMPDLAEIEEKRGHIDVALDWLARSYNESQGAATRFQWGVHYLRALIRLKPYEDSTILSVSMSVLGELDGPDRIYQRTRSGLSGLDRDLQKWNTNDRHAAAIATLRERMDGICSQIPKTDPANAPCRGFLNRNKVLKT